jgi:8-oxo-dGTP pyrophosphatase MutT (NUDIX family)
MAGSVPQAMTQRQKILEDWLGQPVHVVVDRPIGFQHKGLVYPVNYGYIPGVLAEDGEEQDVYILGIDSPLEAFDGYIIGAVVREDDCEDKLVAAPSGCHFHQGQIADAVEFQERYFQSKVISLFRKSCGVIPYRVRENTKEYLILLQTNQCWSFPKGHMEAGEDEEKTALRELAEETGLTVSLLPDSRTVLDYVIPPMTQKQVVLYLGQAHGDVALQEQEVIDYRWVAADKLPDYLHSDTYEAIKDKL